MNPVLIFDLITLVAVLVALTVLALNWKRALRGDTKAILTGLLALIMFDSLSNVLEWSGITAALDSLEDYTQILSVLFWGTLVYALIWESIEGELTEGAENLQREADLVSRITETSPAGIVMVDRHGEISFANPRGEAVLELTRNGTDKDNYSMPERQVTTLDGRPVPDKELTLSLVTQSRRPVHDLRHVLIYPDGRRKLISINAAPLFDNEGEIDGVVMTVEDITEEVERREALRQANLVVENSPAILFRWRNAEGWPVAYVSENISQWGYSARDLMSGKIFFIDLIFPDDLARVSQEVAHHIARGSEQFQQEYRIITREGRVRWLDDRTTTQRDAEGKISHFQGLVLDITERKEAELEIIRLQHLLQNITDSMPSALITVDLEGQVLTWNPAAQLLTGQSGEQVRGEPLWQSCPELARYRSLFEKVIQEGRTAHRHREPVLDPQGGTSYREVSAFPLETNEVAGVVLRIDDVTRRVQLEEMMLQSAKMASVGGLAAGVAHEINNPLGAMMQSAQMLELSLDTERPSTRERLEQSGISPERLARYCRERGLPDYLVGIRTAGSRAAKIVSDLLSFSRKGPSEMAPHDLNRLVEQTLDLASTDYDLQKKYDFRDLILEQELAPDLPLIMCNGQQIQQVILNLVRNAAQAMAEKGKSQAKADWQPRLMLRSSQPSPSHVRLEVEDNGPGIPEMMKAHLFQPFFTTKTVGEGTGLGLWLCWSIVVEHHQGRIRAESGREGGCRFIVDLPLGPHHSNESRA